MTLYNIEFVVEIHANYGIICLFSANKKILFFFFFTGEDTRMRFSLTPQPGESGFIQWLDAMKMVAKLQGGIPAEFRRKVIIIN